MVQEGKALEGMCHNITSHRPCMDSHNLFICLSGRSLLTDGKSRIRTQSASSKLFFLLSLYFPLIFFCVFLNPPLLGRGTHTTIRYQILYFLMRSALRERK